MSLELMLNVCLLCRWRRWGNRKATARRAVSRTRWMSMAGRRRRPGRPSRRRASTGRRARASPPCRCCGRDQRPNESETPTSRLRGERTRCLRHPTPPRSLSNRWRRSRPPRPISGAPAPYRPIQSCARRVAAAAASSAHGLGHCRRAGSAVRACAVRRRAWTTRPACAAWRRCSTTVGAARRRRASRVRAGRGWRAWARWLCRCRACGCTGRCGAARRRGRRCTRAVAAPAAAARSLRRGSPVLSSPAARRRRPRTPKRRVERRDRVVQIFIGERRASDRAGVDSVIAVLGPSVVWAARARRGRPPCAAEWIRVPCKYSCIVWMYVNVSPERQVSNFLETVTCHKENDNVSILDSTQIQRRLRNEI